MSGFFPPSKLISTKVSIPRIAQCGSCSLYKSSKSPKMKPSGLGRKKILIVGEAPSTAEDNRGKHFVGESGKLLKHILAGLDVKMNRDCWMTNAVICHPTTGVRVTSEHAQACVCNLFKTIKELKPNVIILLGNPSPKVPVALQSFIGTIQNESIGSMSAWVGCCIPNHDPNVWVCPTYHPTFLLQSKNDALNKQVRNHLKVAIKKHKSKPWEVVPSFEKAIEIIYKPSQAAMLMRELTPKTRLGAFDFEGNCLKPEYHDAEITSASISFDGKRTIAFPFSGKAVEAFVEFLKSPCGKIASNMKFENRWCDYMLKTEVKNWYWDTMLAAHVLNNRTRTGLKFQAYALLGQRSYNHHIEPFLSTTGKEHLNRVHEIPIKDLLLYNGLDSLLEFRVAMIQKKAFKKNGR